MTNLSHLKTWGRIKSGLGFGTLIALMMSIPLFKPLGSPPPPGGSFFFYPTSTTHSPTPQLDAWLLKRIKYLWKDTLAFHYEINPTPHLAIDPRSDHFKRSLYRQAQAFFNTDDTQGTYDLFGPAFYASFDPVSSRGFGGNEKNEWLLYVVPLKKGLRFLDLRDDESLTPEVEEELTRIGCKLFPASIGSVFSNCRKPLLSSIRRLGIDAAIYYFASLHIPNCNTHSTDSIALFRTKSVDLSSLMVLAENQAHKYLPDALLKRLVHTLYLKMSQSAYQGDSVIHSTLYSNPTLATVGDSIFNPWMRSNIFPCQPHKENISITNLIAHFEFFRSRLMYRLENWSYKLATGKAFIKKHLDERVKSSHFVSGPAPLTKAQLKTWSELQVFDWDTLFSLDDVSRDQAIKALINIWNKSQPNKIKYNYKLSNQLKIWGEKQNQSLNTFKMGLANNLPAFRETLKKLDLPDAIVFFIIERIFGIELTLNPWEIESHRTSFEHFIQAVHHSAESFKTCLDIVLSTSDDSMKSTECEVIEVE